LLPRQSDSPKENEVNNKSLAASLVALAAMLAIAAPTVAQDKKIAIDGSSTVFPVAEAIAEEFEKANKGVQVTVGISGTGGGFKKFCRGETDISNGSRPILTEEMAACKKSGVEFFELPIAFDALTVAVSPKNNFIDCITVTDLKKMWGPAAQRKVTRWKDVNEKWPDQPLNLYGAGADSGTFDYFTEATVGKAKSSRGDYTASEDDNVLVQGIENDINALGYIPYAYYEPHAKKMKALGVDWGKGEGCVKPSLEAVLDGKYSPLSRPLFLYVSKTSAQRPEVQALVEFALTKGPVLIKEVRYLPLPEAAYKMGLERFKSGQLGTGFAGVPEVGLPVTEILKKKPVL
jgi:phosphate transport system substrate-binding protein